MFEVEKRRLIGGIETDSNRDANADFQFREAFGAVSGHLSPA